MCVCVFVFKKKNQISKIKISNNLFFFPERFARQSASLLRTAGTCARTRPKSDGASRKLVSACSHSAVDFFF